VILLGEQLGARLGALGQGSLWGRVQAASARTGRPVGVSAHLLGAIDWTEPERCPIRRQLLPVVEELEPDHPLCQPDPLAEARDAIAPGLIHRYPDRALLISTPRCPVYCAFCTRSWSVGPTRGLARRVRWEAALEALEARPAIVDVTVSGGDTWSLPAAELAWLGARLLALPGLRRLRFATRGLVADPGQLHEGGLHAAFAALASRARDAGVRVALHAHVNHPRELGPEARSAAAALREAGLTLRSQTVLLRAVNDEVELLLSLIDALVAADIQPYYVYAADMVPGAEHLRTSLAHVAELEKQLRGRTAGFDTPHVVCDLLGGGGKRQIHSWERYDRGLGLAVFRSPVVDPDGLFLHADPLRGLEPAVQRLWADPGERADSIARQLDLARCSATSA